MMPAFEIHYFVDNVINVPLLNADLFSLFMLLNFSELCMQRYCIECIFRGYDWL